MIFITKLGNIDQTSPSRESRDVIRGERRSREIRVQTPFVPLNRTDLLDSHLTHSVHLIDLIHDLLPESWWLSSSFGKLLIKLFLGKHLEDFMKVKCIYLQFVSF